LAEITWTRESEIWLEDIYGYIAADDPEAAERTVSLIYEKAQLLRNHPRLGYKYEPEQSREVRILLSEHYRIAYLVKPGDNIEILGVFHGALDIDRYFI
jgi:plasmid stabilization system protein ParE